MNLKLGLLSLGFALALAACGERGGFIADSGPEIRVSTQIQKTDRNLTPRNTYVIEMPDQAPLMIGALNARDLDLTYDKTKQSYKLTGGYEILDPSGHTISSQKFELSGAQTGDHPVLLPAFDDTGRDERVRAALTCLTKDNEGACTKVILDLVVKKIGLKENLATQVEIDLEKKVVVEQKPSKPKAETKKPEVKPEAPQAPTAPSPRKEDTPQTETPKPATPAPTTPTPTPTPDVKPPTPAPAPTAPEVKPEETPTDLNNQDHETDEDEDEEGGLYVGTLYQDSDRLFTMNGGQVAVIAPDETKPDSKTPVAPKADAPKTETPKPTTPAPTTSAPSTTQRRDSDRDQAVGMAARGTLEHPSSLMESMRKGEAPAVTLIYPSRERFYGTWEMIDTVEKISNYMRQSVLPGYTMAIGDISQKSGGQLVGSAHKSHQNGLDADIAYPMANTHELSFTDLVTSGRVSQALRLKETFQLFEYAQKNLRNVDRIFVDVKIKKALCDMSSQQGMIASGRATEVLRRLRPADGHDNHFHLRIRCSPQQPRCRMMAEPAAGTGCETLR